MAMLKKSYRPAAAEELRPGRNPFLIRGIFCLKTLILGIALIYPPLKFTAGFIILQQIST